MEKELKEVYEKIREGRLSKLRSIENEYPTRRHDTIWFKYDIDCVAEELIEGSNFGEISSEIEVNLRRSDRAVLYGGRGISRDISEYGLIKYAKTLFRENLEKFGKAEIDINIESDYYGSYYTWKATFDPIK